MNSKNHAQMLNIWVNLFFGVVTLSTLFVEGGQWEHTTTFNEFKRYRMILADAGSPTPDPHYNYDPWK